MTEAVSTTARLVVAIVGNPNTGKSTLFNALTGFRQHVGNYPGVTVEKKTGSLRSHRDRVDLIDLPGTYSLTSDSLDEMIVTNVLFGHQLETTKPDVILVVVDAAHLATNLFLVSQVLEIGVPVVVAVNMIDLAASAGIKVDTEQLSKELGVPAIGVVATKGQGIDELSDALAQARPQLDNVSRPVFPAVLSDELDGFVNELNALSVDGAAPICRAEALQVLLDADDDLARLVGQRIGADLESIIQPRRQRIEESGESLSEVEGRVRHAWSEGVAQRCVKRAPARGPTRSELADRILTHRLAGLLVVAVVMGLCFQAVYAWAAPLMDLIDGGFVALGEIVESLLPEGALRSLVVNGVVAGVGGVLVFLPQILVLFLFIAILEDCGFMARAAFLLDRWMALIGLNGKSFIPLLSSFACAIPGIMAARTITDRRDRFITIMIAPLMSCSARLPVYVLLISAFVPNLLIAGGWIRLQALTLLIMYALGALVAIPVAFVLSRTVLPGKAQPFLLELPTYKWPSAKTVLYRMYAQGKAFCISAGTIIFAVTIIIWAMGYYPRSATIQAEFAAKRTAEQRVRDTRVARSVSQLDGFDTAQDIEATEPFAGVLAVINDRHATCEASAESLAEGEPINCEDPHLYGDILASHGAVGQAAFSASVAQRRYEQRSAQLDQEEAGALLRHSVLGRLGRLIEPIVKPLGWDWRIGTAVVASFPAREVVIATLGTIYNLGEDQDETSRGLRETLQTSTWPDGRPVFNLPVALSIMVFFALCCQCGATLAVMRRETNSWRWPVGAFVYMTVLAYVAALATYQIGMKLA